MELQLNETAHLETSAELDAIANEFLTEPQVALRASRKQLFAQATGVDTQATASGAPMSAAASAASGKRPELRISAAIPPLDTPPGGPSTPGSAASAESSSRLSYGSSSSAGSGETSSATSPPQPPQPPPQPQPQPPPQPPPLSSGAGASDAVGSRPGTAGILIEPISWQRGQLIGSGSFGKVFFGLNTRSGELMAVKQIAYGGVATPSESALHTAEALQGEVVRSACVYRRGLLQTRAARSEMAPAAGAVVCVVLRA